MTGAIALRTDSEASIAKITRHSHLLAAQLQALRTQLYPPEAQKSLKSFTSREAATMVGIAKSTLRQMSLDGESVVPELHGKDNRRRAYTLRQINEISRAFRREASQGCTGFPSAATPWREAPDRRDSQLQGRFREDHHDGTSRAFPGTSGSTRACD